MAMDDLDGFYSASRARNIAIGGGSGATDLLTEINTYRTEINTAAQSGLLTVSIVGLTPITSYDNYNGSNTSSFYDEWSGAPTNALDDTQKNTRQISRELMYRAIGYLNRLGYQVSRSRDGSNNRLKLTISW